MAEFHCTYSIHLSVSQEARGAAIAYKAEFICDRCGSGVKAAHDLLGVTLNDLTIHSTFECTAITACSKPECKLSRHLGECFHDGGTR